MEVHIYICGGRLLVRLLSDAGARVLPRSKGREKNEAKDGDGRKA